MRARELFGCAGGMAEGFRRAGIEFELSFDRDPDACASYARNLGHEPLCVDVHELLPAEQPMPPLDLLVADPPCTPWSRAGNRRGLDDPRDCLVATRDLILAWRPRAYLIGNIPGLDDASNLSVLRDLFAPLATAGYCVADFVRLDAADFGVPQRRVRPFWFGHRGGSCLTWPTPTHCNPALLAPVLFSAAARLPWVSCREALGHLPADEIGELVTHLRMNPRHPPCRGGEPARTQTARAAGGHAGAQLLEWPWDRPATTVMEDARLATPGHHARSGQFGIGSVRKLSERARAVLQGFPEHWEFVGRTQRSRAGQIGMAMPPPLAHAVATSIRQWFDAHP